MNGTGMSIGMWVFWIITFLIIVLIIKVVIGSDNKTSSLPPESPMEILTKRFARGEIDKDEFENIKNELEK